MFSYFQLLNRCDRSLGGDSEEVAGYWLELFGSAALPGLPPVCFNVDTYLGLLGDLRDIQLPEGVNRRTWAIHHYLEYGCNEIERRDRPDYRS